MKKKRINKILILIALLTIILVGYIFLNKISLNDKKSSGPFATEIPVLVFHRTVPKEDKEKYYKDNEWVASITQLESMAAYIKETGYKTISMDEFYNWYSKKIELPEKSVLITFDDGYDNNYYFAYQVLKKYNLKATFFIVGSWTKDKTGDYISGKEQIMGFDKINDIKENYPNIEFQSHSWNYHSRGKIESMTRAEMEDDTDKMINLGFEFLAYPYGHRNDLIKEVLKEKGIKIAFRFGPPAYATRESDQYAMERIKVNDEADLEYLKSWLK